MRGLAPFWIDPGDTTYRFPDVSLALDEPDGLLAIGGSLSPERLINAYCQGIFPWYNEEQPILWWSPNPRAVLIPEKLHISRSLNKTLRKNPFTLSLDRAFDAVVEACSQPRQTQSGTWISQEIKNAYSTMHELGLAHSVECWLGDKLVGGLYGLAFGKVFFGESMFSRATDASKYAFSHFVRQLQKWGFELVDCQVQSQHLASLGSELMPRHRFIQLLENLCYQPTKTGPWQFDAPDTESTDTTILGPSIENKP